MALAKLSKEKRIDRKLIGCVHYHEGLNYHYRSCDGECATCAAVTSEIARAQARGREVDEPLRRSQGWTLTHSFVVIAAWKLKSVIKASISINESLT